MSHGLVKACKDDIKVNHCRRSLSNDKEIRLAQILMCLEGLIRNGMFPPLAAKFCNRKLFLKNIQLNTARSKT